MLGFLETRAFAAIFNYNYVSLIEMEALGSAHFDAKNRRTDIRTFSALRCEYR